MTLSPLIIGAIAAAGLGGVALGATVLGTDSDSVSTPSLEAFATVERSDVAGAAYECPGETASRVLSPGDRVFVVGTDNTGTWRAFRDPQQLDATLWLPASALSEDSPADLPILACGQDPEVDSTDTAATAVPTPSQPSATSTQPSDSSDPTSTTSTTGVTTTISSTTSTTTVAPASTATTRPTTLPTTPRPTTPPTPAATTAPPATNAPPPSTSPPPATSPPTLPTTSTTTTTTVPPDATPPSVFQASASPNSIFTISAGVDGCGEASAITVTATDDRGIAQVTGSYGSGLPGSPFTLSPIGGSNYQGTFGPFSSPPTSPQVPITITARDAAGNSSTTSVTVTVNGCPF